MKINATHIRERVFRKKLVRFTIDQFSYLFLKRTNYSLKMCLRMPEALTTVWKVASCQAMTTIERRHQKFQEHSSQIKF